ncbi:MAG: TIGR03560 family F420-dependent LLM class oxidoreductase [Streptosporangiales bacterium]|nr:TIGR03560 family F420-dependent LLM class oxidoreductase [Streptosporangiales bacterium]
MTRMIEFGIYLPQVGLGFEDILDRARTMERLGYDALWMYDHLYAPGAPQAPSLEAWTLATALLARTSRLRAGHMVTCNNFRHPAVLAKMAATLDVISGGRLEFGIGSGSVELEHEQAGLPWGPARERSARLEESLEIITRMFAEPGGATFKGEHYEIRDLPCLPAPVQRPRPPVHVGGAGPKFTLPLVARYADVWNVPTYALDRVGELSRRLDEECEKIGRDPATIRRSVEAVLVIAEPADLDAALTRARRHYGHPGFGLDAGGLAGNPDQIAERISVLAGAGISSFVFFTHDRASTSTLELFAEAVMPRVTGSGPAGA